MHITTAEILDRKILDGPGDAVKQLIDGHQISPRSAPRQGPDRVPVRTGSAPPKSGSLLIHPSMSRLPVLTTADGVTVFAGHPTPSMLRPMPNATTRAIFRLDPSCCLCYNDARRFGWIRPSGPDPCRADAFLSRLGPEPLGEDFTPAALRQALARHPRAPVKALLLDRTAIAGVGNIHADESLRVARIHPSCRRAASARPRPAACTPRSGPSCARRPTAAGTSFTGYVNEACGHASYIGQGGVFRRQGLPCDVCGTPIIRTTVAGHATNFCPHCQQR